MEHNDRPRAEIMAMADSAIKDAERQNIKAWVYFKYTCSHCGERVTLRDKNTLWENGECAMCGETTRIDKAGFSLLLEMK